MKRTKLCDRQLPNYTVGEERMNMLTHIVGGIVGIAALLLCILQAVRNNNIWGIVTAAIYGASMVTMFTVSSVYHGLKATLRQDMRLQYHIHSMHEYIYIHNFEALEHKRH